MTREEVRTAVGAPDDTRPSGVDAAQADVWVYRRTRTNVVQKTVGSQNVPYVDPFTGQTRMIPEPIYAMETTTIVLHVTLFWKEGVLERWTTETSDSRAFHP